MIFWKSKEEPPFEVGRLYRRKAWETTATVGTLSEFVQKCQEGDTSSMSEFPIGLNDIVMVVAYQHFSKEECMKMFGHNSAGPWWKIDILGKEPRVGFIWLTALKKKEKKAGGIHDYAMWYKTFERVE